MVDDPGQRHYGRCRIDAPAELEDEVSTLLWEAGTTGFEVRPGEAGRLLVEAYFPGDAPPLSLPDGALVTTSDRVAERDWLSEYRRHAQPVRVGRRFLLDPGEPDADEVVPAAGADSVPTGRTRLRLPARRAFGTGSHPTTRLVVERLEELADSGGLVGAAVLDVGCGTGVLCFAALVLGARSAVAFDLDPVAPLTTIENRALNDAHLGAAALGCFAGTAEALAPRAVFDLVLVNVLAARIRGDIPHVARLVAPGGRIVVSGLLQEESREELERWRAEGLLAEAAAVTAEGEWCCATLLRSPATPDVTREGP